MSRGYNVPLADIPIPGAIWPHCGMQEAVKALNDFQTNASELEKQRFNP